ncbi:MAG: Uma2 family endonuclease [Acidimicrobiales bacterium]
MALETHVESFTVDDWLATPEGGNRWELVDGALVVNPAPAWQHQRAVAVLFSALRAEVPGADEVFVSPVGVRLGIETVVEPDLAVVHRSSLGERLIEGVPILVVEVLSPSNRPYDLVTKRDLYARNGIRWYWIADPAVPSVTVLRLDGDAYVEHVSATGDEALTVDEPYPITLELRRIVAG